MKAHIKNLVLLAALIAGLGLLPVGRVTAQTFTTLHSFTNYPTDGATPNARLVVSGKTLYGTAASGGTANRGALFAINTDGTGFTTLHSFAAGSGPLPSGRPPYYFTNTDGTFPGPLFLSGNTLYGTASVGGNSANGTVFALNTDGTGFTYLHNFTPFAPDNSNSDGATPSAGLILSGNTLYGTAFYGGTSGNGTVFSISLPPPQLTITASAGGIILTWPAEAAGFYLQSTTNIVSPVAWSDVFSEAVVVNGENTVINLISATQHFYQLSKETWRCRSNFEL